MCFTGPFGTEMTHRKGRDWFLPRGVLVEKSWFGEISSRKQGRKAVLLQFLELEHPSQAISTDEFVGPMVVGGATQLDFS